jgi:hypothetical protein
MKTNIFTSIKIFFRKVNKRILHNPLFFSLSLCLILSVSLFYIDKSIVAIKAEKEKDIHISIIEHNFLMITNQSKYLNDSLKIYLFSDTTLPIYQYGINTTDTSAIIQDFIGGYIKVDCIYNTRKDSVIGYRYGDTLSKQTKNESGVTIYPYKIVTSDSNSSEIMSEILNIVQTNDYFAGFQNKKLGVDFVDCYLPPNYLTTTNHYLVAIVTK